MVRSCPGCFPWVMRLPAPPFLSLCLVLVAVGHARAQCSTTPTSPPPVPRGTYRGPQDITRPAGPSTPRTPQPATPATPHPTGPGTPTAGPVTGPATGGARRGPVTPGPRVTGPRAVPGFAFTRSRTVRKLLQVDWDFALTPRNDDPRTRAADLSALPRAAAFAHVAGDDPRPLLVLRECEQCKNSDRALLGARLANEEMILRSQWFHCVKLPETVLYSNHPLHNLLQPDARGHLPHLFLAHADGSGYVGFDGAQTHGQLRKAMRRFIEEFYAGDARRAARNALKLLDKIDAVDTRMEELEPRLEQALDDHGPRSSKVRSLQKKLHELGKQRQELLEKVRRNLDLPRRAARRS